MTSKFNIRDIFKSRKRAGFALASLAAATVIALSFEESDFEMNSGTDIYNDVYASAEPASIATHQNGMTMPSGRPDRFDDANFPQPFTQPAHGQPSFQPMQAQPSQVGHPQQTNTNPQQALLGSWVIQDQQNGGQMMVQFSPDGSFAMAMQNRYGNAQGFGNYQIVGAQNGTIQVRMVQTSPRKMKPTMNNFTPSPDGRTINYDGAPGYRVQ